MGYRRMWGVGYGRVMWYLLSSFGEQVREVPQHALVDSPAEERGGDPLATSSPGPADPVHIVLDVLRHIVIYHVLDVRKIQT